MESRYDSEFARMCERCFAEYDSEFECWCQRVIAEYYQDYDTTEEFSGVLRSQTYHNLRYSPGKTSATGITYHLQGGVLAIYGDCGYAMYGVREQPSLRAVAQLTYDEFCLRCLASEVGTSYREWDPRVAWARLVRYWVTCPEPNPMRHLRGSPRAIVRDASAWRTALFEAASACGIERYADGEQQFGEAWHAWERIGYRVHDCCLLHLGGLRLLYGINLREGFDGKSAIINRG